MEELRDKWKTFKLSENETFQLRIDKQTGARSSDGERVNVY